MEKRESHARVKVTHQNSGNAANGNGNGNGKGLPHLNSEVLLAPKNDKNSGCNDVLPIEVSSNSSSNYFLPPLLNDNVPIQNLNSVEHKLSFDNGGNATESFSRDYNSMSNKNVPTISNLTNNNNNLLLKRPYDSSLGTDFPATVVLPSSTVPTPPYYPQQQQQKITLEKLQQQVVALAMSSHPEIKHEEAESAATAEVKQSSQQTSATLPSLSSLNNNNNENSNENNNDVSNAGVVMPSPQMHLTSKIDISYLCNDNDDDSLFILPGNNIDNGVVKMENKVVENDENLNLLLPPFKVLIQNNLN